MHYNYNTILNFVVEILQGSTKKRWHLTRLKAFVLLLRGLLLLKQASLSGMGRGAATIDKEKTFIGEMQRAHRLIKNTQVKSWDLAQGLYRYMTQNLKEVLIAVDWTDVGDFKVLEASLLVAGRGIAFYSLAVHRHELVGRQTTLERTMCYALCALRRPGQVLRVVVDRGFAKFDFIGKSPLYPDMYLIVRLKGSMILTWGSIRGALRQWPLYAGEVVRIEQAYLGQEAQVVTAVCLAYIAGQAHPIYLACTEEDLEHVLPCYARRPQIEQQNRDAKSSYGIRKLHLRSADRPGEDVDFDRHRLLYQLL